MGTGLTVKWAEWDRYTFAGSNPAQAMAAMIAYMGPETFQTWEPEIFQTDRNSHTFLARTPNHSMCEAYLTHSINLGPGFPPFPHFIWVTVLR